jgi:hypothetical protein
MDFGFEQIYGKYEEGDSDVLMDFIMDQFNPYDYYKKNYRYMFDIFNFGLSIVSYFEDEADPIAVSEYVCENIRRTIYNGQHTVCCPFKGSSPYYLTDFFEKNPKVSLSQIPDEDRFVIETSFNTKNGLCVSYQSKFNNYLKKEYHTAKRISRSVPEFLDKSKWKKKHNGRKDIL